MPSARGFFTSAGLALVEAGNAVTAAARVASEKRVLLKEGILGNRKQSGLGYKVDNKR